MTNEITDAKYVITNDKKTFEGDVGSDGIITIGGVSDGEYTVTVNCEGYKPYSEKITVNGRTDTKITIKLAKDTSSSSSSSNNNDTS